MSYPSFTAASETVDRFLAILAENGLDLSGSSENEALAMMGVLDMWRGRSQVPADSRPVVRAALGFVDLAGKVVGVREHKDFGSLIPHLKMLAKTTVLQNASSPVTDDAGNKVIELYVAALAMTFADEVKLDHPSASKGDNPDVLLRFRGKRWALALKTLHSRSPRTIYDNIKKATDQIESSAADHGLVVLNAKNLLDYTALWPSATAPLPEVVVTEGLRWQMADIMQPLAEITDEDWQAAFAARRKAQKPVVSLGSTASSAMPSHGGGPHFMAMKSVMTYLDPREDPAGGMKVVKELHHASQQFY